MATSIDAELRELRTKISTIQSRRARAEVSRDNAKDALGAARQVLKEEFGVVTPQDAKDTLSKLSTDLQTALDNVRTELEAAGA